MWYDISDTHMDTQAILRSHSGGVRCASFPSRFLEMRRESGQTGMPPDSSV